MNELWASVLREPPLYLGFLTHSCLPELSFLACGLKIVNAQSKHSIHVELL